MNNKRPHVTLKLDEKVQIIKMVESGQSTNFKYPANKRFC